MYKSSPPLRKILFYIHILFAICLLLAYAGYFISPSLSYIPAFFGLSYFIWLVINLLFIPIWVILKIRYSLLSIIVIAIGFPLHQKQFSTNFSLLPEKSNGHIKLMSYNVQLFGLYNWKENKKHRNKIFQFLKDESPDIISFQEFYQDDLHRFKTTDTLKEILGTPYVHFGIATSVKGNQHWGVATYSKLPIIHKGQIKFPNSRTNICIYSDIKWGEDTVRIFNVHFQSNHLHTESIEKIIAGDSTASVLAFDMARALKKGYVKRSEQADLVAEAVVKSPYPVILSGDFNDVPISYTYHKLSEKLQDSFLESGAGFGFTYAGRIPFLRIDYILHSPQMESQNAEVIREKLSDHYPIAVELKMRENQADSSRTGTDSSGLKRSN